MIYITSRDTISRPGPLATYLGIKDPDKTVIGGITTYGKSQMLCPSYLPSKETINNGAYGCLTNCWSITSDRAPSSLNYPRYNVAHLKIPSATLLMTESLRSNSSISIDPRFWDSCPDYRHMGKANFLMQDGHVDAVAPNAITGMQAKNSHAKVSTAYNEDESLFWHGFSTGKDYKFKPYN